MDSLEAREHLELVDRILADTNRRLYVGGEFFVIWGIVCATIDVVYQLVMSHKVPPNTFWVAGLALLLGIIFSAVQGWRIGQSRKTRSLAQRQYLNVLWISFALVFVVQMFATTLFADWNRSALWSFASAIVLLYLGSLGNYRAVAGGIVLVLSLIIANFTPNVIGYVLAAGMLIGYAGFGLVTLAARD